MKASSSVFYRLCRWLVRGMLGFYFARIERFHGDRVPTSGPVLFASNHPNSLTDAFVIGASVARKVNFVGTVQLFQARPVKWLLNRCGVIAINRVKDDPRNMRSVLKTFEACFGVLEKGEAVAIFPEGITTDGPQLKTVKTGAARMALDLEHRHGGTLGLHIVPVGLTFSAKDRYRSDALVNFGEPLRVAVYLKGYEQNRHECIQRLTAEIERRIVALIYHLPHLERERIVEGVKRLYLERLWVGNTVIHEPVTPAAGELLLTQAITEAVEGAFIEHGERAAEFVRKLEHYERVSKRLRLPDEVLAHFPERHWMLRKSLAWMSVALLGAPIAVYGWAHRLIPCLVVEKIVALAAKRPADRTHVSTATMLGGMVVFTAFYGLCVFIFHRFFGWQATLWYAASLPVASLVAHYYWRDLRRIIASFRAAAVLLRAPAAAARLQALRSELIDLIETERRERDLARAGVKEMHT